MDSQGIDHVVVNSTVAYIAKVKADNHYWLKYVSPNDGQTYYVPYATIVDSGTGELRYYGEDSNWGDPVYAQDTGGGETGGSDNDGREQGGQHMDYSLSGATAPYSNLDSYVFPMESTRSHLIMTSNAMERTQPDMSLTGVKGHYEKENLYYSAKTLGTNRMWVRLLNGNYLPIGLLSKALPNLTKNKDTSRTEQVGDYVKDVNTSQPYENVWPYSALVGGTSRSGGTLPANATEWKKNIDLIQDTPTSSLNLTYDEQAEFDRIEQEIAQNKQSDDVLIGYITDTHFDSYQTPSSAAVLRSMKLLSYFAHAGNPGLDLVIHGGDLNDGTKPKALSNVDIQMATDAIKMSERPYIILQGNHDDNSGYSRDMSGYLMNQVISNTEAWNMRASNCLQRATGSDNPNGGVYGRYDLPNSNVSILVLDGFDQGDIEENDTNGNIVNWSTPHFNTFRHGFTRYSNAQVTWAQNMLAQLKQEDRQVMVFNHIAPRGVNTYGWNQKNENTLSNRFEIKYDLTKNSQRIYDSLTPYANNIIGYMAGHTHEDDYNYSGGIQFVTTTCAIADRGTGSQDGNRPDGSLYVGRNDKNKFAFDILQISPSQRTVKRHRFGYGSQSSDFSGWFLSNWQW